MEEKRYSYVSTAIQYVMANIDEYVIPENRKIIEYLWDMNILTTHTNNYENDFSWVALGELSEENHEIFWSLANKMGTLDERKEPKFSNNQAISVPVVPGSKDTFEDFKPLVDLLKFQDVQKDGYMTIEEFLINYTDCYSIIDNPDYENLKEPFFEDFNDIKEYKKAVDEYFKRTSLKRIKVVDQSKMTKTIEEYLEEAGLLDFYDKEENKVFYNKRLYDGHMRYKEEYSKSK